jgi:Tfp pilus assembly protein PilF
VSRVHDALRRGRTPAKEVQASRRPHAETVLAALGHRSERAGGRRRTLLVMLLLVVLGGSAWTLRTPFTVRGSQLTAATPPPAIATRSQTPDVKPLAPPSAPSTPATVERDPQPEIRERPRDRTAKAPNADLFQLALYHQRAGDFEQALVNYKLALQRNELNVEAHNNLGGLYLGRNLLGEAVREFERALAIDPAYVPARVNLSATFYKQGRFDAAAAQSREVLRVDPRNVDAFVNLALAQKGGGQVADSQISLRRALELDPHHALAHYNLARQYEDGGETLRAFEHYRQFLQYAGPEQEPYAAEVRTRLKRMSDSR